MINHNKSPQPNNDDFIIVSTRKYKITFEPYIHVYSISTHKQHLLKYNFILAS